jgi:hypothetical protein
MVVSLVVMLIVPPTGAADAPAEESDPAEGTGMIRGKVFGETEKNPVEAATVHAYHLGTQKVFQSAPTDAKGRFEMTGLPFGYADMFVETPEGVFVANRVVSIPPAAKFTLTFVLSTYDEDSQEWWTGREPKQIAVLDKPATGIAHIQEDSGDRKFWTSPAGIGIMAGGGGLALLAIVASGDDPAEPQVSPFQP